MVDRARVGEAAIPVARNHHHLGWQLTGTCNRACRHCLRRREDKPSTELDEEACSRILESYLAFVEHNGLLGSIMYSGGNPMLRRDLPRLLERTARAKQEGIIGQVTILANPETIDAGTAAHLAACLVDRVSISLDGRQEGNDRMRGQGSYEAAIAAIPRLAAAGVRVDIKFTLSRCNFLDAPHVFELAQALGASSVGIGIMSRPSAAGDLSDLMVTPGEYRQHLASMVAYDDQTDEERRRFFRSSVRFHRGLYALLFHELGRYGEFADRIGRPGEPRSAMRGPGGRRRGMFVVWEDGSVHVSNSEAQPILGMVPGESFQAIHERRIAGCGDAGTARGGGDPVAGSPTSPACVACPVRDQCPGDDPLCWKHA